MTVQWEQYGKVNAASNDPTLYGDIICHCRDYKHYWEPGSKYTSAHECTHGINNDLRLASGDWDGKNGFYVGKDRAIILGEPKFKKHEIVEFIPEELRSARYGLYVVGQQSWDDKPLYIYDEGVAYVNGAWAAIELKEQENYVESHTSRGCHYAEKSGAGKSGNTIVDGEIEFIPYMAAVLLTADKQGQLQPEIVDFSRWLFRHASNAYFRSLKDGFPAFDVQDKLWASMKSGAAYTSQRSFLEKRIGYVFPDGEVPEDDSPPWYI